MLEAGSIMERQSDLIGTRSNPLDFLRLLISSDEGSQPHCIYINFLHSRYVFFYSRPSGMKLIPKYTSSFIYVFLHSFHTDIHVQPSTTLLRHQGMKARSPWQCLYRGGGSLRSTFWQVLQVDYSKVQNPQCLYTRWTILQCLYSHLIGDVEEPIWL